MLTEKSLSRLATVKPSLAQIIQAAAANCPVPFQVTEGIRSKERQAMLCLAGKSQTLNSRHCMGEAVDVVAIIDGKADWAWKHYETIAVSIKAAAAAAGVPVEWGGDWRTFKDGVHFQLKRTY